MMVRIWEKIRQPPMQAWCRERAGPWDQAVERSPALRCALIRCAMAEAAAECGMDAALSMVDLEKFYDTIRIDHLVNMALTLQAPARVLLIDLMAYLAPRAIQYLGAVSQWLNPGVSIVQGSRNSNNWARILLYDVLERAQARVPLGLPLPVGGRHQSPRDRHAEAHRNPLSERHPRATRRPTEQRVTHLHQVPDCGFQTCFSQAPGIVAGIGG